MNEKKVDFLGEEPTYKKGGIIMFDKMKLKLKKVMKNEKGMTLIELLAVLVIIAIVALIAVPAIGSIINKSNDKAVISSAANIMDGAKIAKSNGDCAFSTATDTTCDQSKLNEYVEGVTGNYSVTYDGGVYTITYPELSKLKTAKYKTYVSGSTITSTNIKLALEGKDVPAANP
ncbi:type II secretion system protein [Rummeliibacillus stabekisii]|nr:type II secretion system protein [Rummeliibacillus stabekisii]